MPSVRVTAKVKSDMKGFNKLKAQFKNQHEAVARVGHFDSKKHTDQDMSIAEVSYINQTGDRKRPYMTIAMQSPAFTKAYKSAQMRVAKGIITHTTKGGKAVNATISKEVKLLAVLLQDLMVGVIETGTGLKRNSAAWIATKGVDAPLMETLTLVDDITQRFMKDLGVNHTNGIETVERSV